MLAYQVVLEKRLLNGCSVDVVSCIIYLLFCKRYNTLNTTTATTHKHTTVLQLYGFCLGQPGWAGIRRNIHPLTPIVVINRLLSASSIYYDPWHPPCSIHTRTIFFYNLSPSFLWSKSWPGTLHFILHTLFHPIIVFLSQHIPIPSQPVLLSVVPRICHLILVSLSTLYLKFFLVVSHHTSI